MRRTNIWSDVEKNFIRDNAATMKDGDAAEALSKIVGRPISVYAWRRQRQMMGIKKGRGRGICKVVSAVPEVGTTTTVVPDTVV